MKRSIDNARHSHRELGHSNHRLGTWNVRIWFLIGSIALLAGMALSARAQPLRYRLPPEDPQWMKWKITSSSVGVYSEGVFEQSRFTGSSSVNYSRLFVGPSLGLGFQGSIYHPNFCRFIFDGEGAFGWGWENIESTTTSKRSQFEQLGTFQTTLYLLSPKPYASQISAAYDHTFRDYDFFNRTIVDTWRYGGQTGYREGPVPFTITYTHLDERDQNVISLNTVTNVTAGGKTNVTTRAVFGTSSLQENTLTFEAHNEREVGTTRFVYTMSDFQRSDVGPESSGRDHTIGVADSELFGAQKQIQWNNDVGYSMRRFTDSPGDDLNANSRLSIDHTPTITTFYDANYYHNNFESASSDSYNGSLGIRHQLYESLISTLRGYGQYYDASGEGGSTVTKRLGTSLSEAYSKRLSSEAHLTIGGTIDYSHTDVDQTGSIITVIEERHTFPTGVGGGPIDTFFLNLPNVFPATIIITDQGRTQTYIQGLHYTVSQNGLLTMITRMSVAGGIPSGATVLVSYNAAPSPSGSYDTVNGLLQVRLDFWNGLLGIYGRANSIQNRGTPGLVVQDLNAVAVGVDTSWRFFRAGGECEIYDSSFSSYRAIRFYQSFFFRPSDASSLNFDFTESWTRYLDADRDEWLYSFISRYHHRLTYRLGADIEAGVSQRYGPGVDQTLAAFRPGLEFAMGKLTAKIGYDLEYERFLNSEERLKHMFFVRLKRTF
jgi:hypothetical protein